MVIRICSVKDVFYFRVKLYNNLDAFVLCSHFQGLKETEKNQNHKAL